MKAEGEIKNRTIFWMGRWSIKSPPPSTTLLVPISVSYIIKASLEYCARQSHVLWIPLLVQFMPSVLLSCPQPTLDNTPKVNIFLMENFMGKFCDLNKFHWPSCPETHTTHYSSFACLWRYCWCPARKYLSSTFVQYCQLLQCWEYRFWMSCLVIGMLMTT